MEGIRRWFAWLVIIGPLHMAEQLLMGINELYEIKRFMAAYHSWFRDPDYGTVVLATIGGTLILLLAYGLLLGGRWRLLAVGFFGVLAVTEMHHIVKTLIHGAYWPGTATAIPFVAVGVLLLRGVVREFRNTASPGAHA